MSGNPIQISKADMIELIRSNMPIASVLLNGLMSKDGFMYRGVIEHSNQPAVNNAKSSGFYPHHAGLYGTKSGWHGVLIVFTASNYIIQVDFPMRQNEHKIFWRVLDVSTPPDTDVNWEQITSITVG